MAEAGRSDGFRNGVQRCAPATDGHNHHRPHHRDAQDGIDALVATVDLPEIVRDSTGALSPDAVRSLRSETMRADDVLAESVDRVLRRKRPDPVDS